MQSDLAKQNMWDASITVVSKSLTTFLSVAAAITFLNILSRQTQELGLLTTLVWSYLAFAAHSIVLKNAPDSALNQHRPTMMQFVLRSYALALTPGLLFLPVLLIGFQQEGVSKEASTLLFAVLTAPFYLAIFGLFGTTLPAVVMSEGYSFKRSLNRGLRTFFPTVGKMLIGPGTLIIATMMFMAVYPLYTGDGRVLDANFGFSFLNLVPQIILALIGAFATVLAAVILSRAYLTGEEKLGRT